MADETKNPFKRMGVEVAGAALFEAVKFFLLLGVGYAISGLGVTWLTTTFQQFVPYKGYLITLSFTAGIFGAIWVHRRFDPFRPHFPKIECDFYILEKRISYKRNAAGQVLYKRQYKLRALRNGLDRFADTYRWTGNGKVDIRSEHPDQEVVQPDTKGVFQVFEVIFERTLNKGDVIDIAVDWDIDDAKHYSKPFIATTIHAPTDSLTLSVQLPPELGVKEVIKEHSPDIGSVKPFDSKSEALAHDKCEWTIKRPKLLHNYSIKWHPKLNNGVAPPPHAG